ncbi:MAG: hypothetical protein LBP59_01965, partial [Planctomycetaceae bacterium]|nr:hypothetical protein [Planctomycetaceae bacterium]
MPNLNKNNNLQTNNNSANNIDANVDANVDAKIVIAQERKDWHTAAVAATELEFFDFKDRFKLQAEDTLRVGH